MQTSPRSWPHGFAPARSSLECHLPNWPSTSAASPLGLPQQNPHNFTPGHIAMRESPITVPRGTQFGTEGANLPANLSGPLYRIMRGHSGKQLSPTRQARPR